MAAVCVPLFMGHYRSNLAVFQQAQYASAQNDAWSKAREAVGRNARIVENVDIWLSIDCPANEIEEVTMARSIKCGAQARCH